MTDQRGIKRGRFISFEGGEGAGKSLQSHRLAATLNAHGIAVSLTREPGGSRGAEEIRELLVTGDPDRWDATCEALLLNAARRDHWRHLIDPALTGGNWVICDRFADSTVVYQGLCGGLDLNMLRTLHCFALGEAMPELTLLLDLSPQTGLTRTRARARLACTDDSRFERMSMTYHNGVRDGFLALARTEPERIVIIDASQDAGFVEAAVLEAVRTRFPELGTR